MSNFPKSIKGRALSYENDIFALYLIHEININEYYIVFNNNKVSLEILTYLYYGFKPNLILMFYYMDNINIPVYYTHDFNLIKFIELIIVMRNNMSLDTISYVFELL